MENIFNLTKEDLSNYFISIGEKTFKAIQIFDWLYVKKVASWGEMTNLKKDIINKLSAEYNFNKIKMIKKQSDGSTVKLLFELEDGEKIESVLMMHDYGVSICVSTQVGCNMGCTFCESGRLKKRRNLNVYEMVEQVLAGEEIIQKRISSVVIMGIGEPLDNYENVLNFIKIINEAKGLAIGARHITLSTCGLIPFIERLAEEKLQINLALSLHSAYEEVRSELMPINKVYHLDELMLAIKNYINKTNRRVTIEYVMLSDINDKISDAEALANLVQGMNVYINLIPYNQTNNSNFKKSSRQQILNFYEVLKVKGIDCTIRQELGSKIDAACGQLRSKEN